MEAILSRSAAARPDATRYTRLPDALLSELTPREHQVMHLLLSYRWYADSVIRPFVSTMAARLGCSRRTVQRALRGLEGKGYLIIVARYREDSDQGQTSNVYAPGPMLLPLLPATDDAPVSTPRQAPMTGTAHKNVTPKNKPKRTVQEYGSKDYLQTRYGSLTVPCSRCGTREHTTRWHV